MRNLFKIFSFILILAISVSCLSPKKISGTSKVTPLSAESGIKEGSLVYSLPMTIFTIKVEMERLIEVPGPYARFASDLLGLSKAIQNEDETWSVKGITINYHEEADPSQFYLIQSNTVFQTNALEMKREGLILDPGSSYSSEKMGSGDSQSSGNFNPIDLGSDEYFQVQRDTAYRRVNVDTSFVRIPYLVEKKKRLSTDQLADKAAKRLMELRDGKILILTGEATVFPQNEAALVELNRLEKEYTELFAGKSWKETKTLTFQFIPAKEMAGKTVELFRFSEKTGPLATADKTGIPVTIELSSELKTRNLNMITAPESPKTEVTYDKMYYRVPDAVNFKINVGDETYYNSRRLIYQFGQVIQLPGNYIIGK